MARHRRSRREKRTKSSSSSSPTASCLQVFALAMIGITVGMQMGHRSWWDLVNAFRRNTGGNLAFMSNFTSVYLSSIADDIASAVMSYTYRSNSTATGVPQLSSSTPPPDFKAKIVGFTDLNYVRIAKKWYDRMTELGYTEHVIVATSPHAYDRLQALNVRVEAAFIPNNSNSFLANWRQIMMTRLNYTRQQLEQGINLLVTDVDNVFMKHVNLYDFYHEGYDVIHAYEVGYPVPMFRGFGFVVCSGHQWLRASNATLRYLELVKTQCWNDQCDDQVAYNQAIHMHAMMKWDQQPTRPDAPRLNWGNDPQHQNCGKLVQSVTGRSTVTNHTVKIWDRDFAWRLIDVPLACPKNNWVAMPTQFRDAKIPNEKVAMKMALMDRWVELCHEEFGELRNVTAPPLVVAANLTCELQWKNR